MMDRTRYLEQLNHYYIAWQACNDAYAKWAKAHGLSANSLFVLSDIYDSKGCTQHEISQRWLIPKQTVNMILKDFEKRGLVELLPTQKDKQNKQILFTSEGQHYAEMILSELREVELFVLKEMGMERIQQLNDHMTLFTTLFIQAGGIHETNTRN